MFALRPILDCDIAYCRMTRSSTAADYGFPLDEENGFPVCLILFSPHFLIEIFDDLIAVINELDLTYELQLFPCRTELHIAELDYFSAVMIIEVLTSSTYGEVGGWAFFASDMASPRCS